MAIERKTISAKIITADETTGTIEAIVAVTNNVDLGKDRIMPGFFTKSIERKLPKGVWAHDWKQPIAKTLEAKELAAGDPLLPANVKEFGGYYIKAQFNLDTQRGKEAHSDIKFGIIDEFSIGYSVEKSDRKDGIRELIEGDWLEWSPVLAGMNTETSLISIKEAAMIDPVPAPAVESKGPVQDVIDAQILSPYQIASIAYSADCAIDNQEDAAETLGQTFDAQPLIVSSCDELRELFFKWFMSRRQMDDDDSYYYGYMGRDGSLSNLNALLELKTALQGSATFKDHSEAVLAAAGESVKQSAVVTGLLSDWAGRWVKMVKSRAKTEIKSGAEISATNRERAKSHYENLKSSRDAIDSVMTGLKEWFDDSEADDPDDVDDPEDNEGDKAARSVEARNLLAATLLNSVKRYAHRA